MTRNRASLGGEIIRITIKGPQMRFDCVANTCDEIRSVITRAVEREIGWLTVTKHFRWLHFFSVVKEAKSDCQVQSQQGGNICVNDGNGFVHLRS